MTRYLLDSTVLIESEKKIEPTSSRVVALLQKRRDLYVCAIALAEFYTGAPRGTNPDMDVFLTKLTYVDLTPEMAATAGLMRYNALSTGRRLATPDALIAACAHHLGAHILTNNVRDFTVTGVATEQLGGEG